MIVATLCRKKICFGINEVTKGLEKDQLRLVLVCQSCKPEMFTQHLIGLAASRNCAASVISNLSLTLCPLLKLSSLLALGVKVIYSWPWSIQFCTKTTLQKKSTFHLGVNRLSNIRYVYEFLQIFSSPELKAQVSLSDRPSSVVHLFDRLSVNFSYFHLLLQSHKGNFKQTWHKASLGKVNSSLLKWMATPFSKGR